MSLGHEHDYPPLLWNFGVSLVERAVLDAFCRAKDMTFAEALRSNALGIRLGQVDGDLAGLTPGELLPEQPLRTPHRPPHGRPVRSAHRR